MDTTYMLNVQETGQAFPLPASIGASDDLIKRSLASVIPYIDTAKLERAEKDGVTTITVTKSHAPKGAGDPGFCFFPGDCQPDRFQTGRHKPRHPYLPRSGTDQGRDPRFPAAPDAGIEEDH